LLWGYGAPDLEQGVDYAATSHLGSGGAGVIETVRPGRIEFSWGGPDWPQPGRFVVQVGENLTVEASSVPEQVEEFARVHWERMVRGASDYLNSRNPPLDVPVRAVLFDADGVLQLPRSGWLQDFTRLGGASFVIDAFAAEVACLSGGDDLRPRLQALLEAAGTGGTVEQVFDVWHDIVVDSEALALVGRLRGAGLIVGLATNQQNYRGSHMRDVLEMDAHFDRVFYSYEVGHAKPSRDYFEHAVAELGVPAGQVVFVDDAPGNVRAARAAGLRGALHRSVNGAAGLAEELAALGARG